MCKYKLERFNEFVWYRNLRLFLKYVRFLLRKRPTTMYMFGFPPICAVNFVKILKSISSVGMHVCTKHDVERTALTTQSVVQVWTKASASTLASGLPTYCISLFTMSLISPDQIHHTAHTIHKFFNITQVMIYLIHIYIIRTKKRKFIGNMNGKKRKSAFFSPSLSLWFVIFSYLWWEHKFRYLSNNCLLPTCLLLFNADSSS